MVVDLPEPFGPSKPNTSPRRTSKSTLSTARALGRPQKSLKTLVRPRTAMTFSAAAAGPDPDFGFSTAIIKFSPAKKHFFRAPDKLERRQNCSRQSGLQLWRRQRFGFGAGAGSVRRRDGLIGLEF